MLEKILEGAILLGVALFFLRIWWSDPLRRCRACGSGLTWRRMTTSGPDSHLSGSWHVQHHVRCFRCKAETAHTVLTGKPPERLVMDFYRKVDRGQ